MRDTHLAVRTDDNQFVLLAPYLQQRGLKRGTDANYNEESERHVTRDQVLSGQLLIGSQSRICRLNDETDPQEWRETGDLVRVVRGKIYYIGRVQDCLVKVNGKKINLLEISTTLKSCPQVREAIVLAVDDFGLVCFVETNELDAVAAVNHFARQHLPSFMRPNHVLVMETVPITLNGKVDKTALRDIFRARVADQSSHTAVDRNAVSAFVLQHWRSAVSGLEDWSEDQIRAHHLVALGASSIDVFECADKLCARLGLNARMNGAEVKQQIHDALLHLNFSEVIDRVMTLTNNKDEKQNSSTFDTSASTDASNALASTLLGTPLRATSRSGVVVTFDPVQHSRRAVLKDIPFKRAALKWKQWLIKCVDASPLVIETAQQKCVVIGSHSGHMTCLELYSGETIWRTYLPDRVESSATLVKVAQQFYICVGCYDHRVYFLNTVDGAVVWSYDLGGQIKSSAAQDPHSELVWIGAHSGTLVVLDVAQRECVMSQHFAAPIFAVPCIDTTRQRVYVAVEDRFLYAFNSAQFNVEWKLNLHAPLFSTPVVTSDGTVVVGGVNKIITAVSVAGVVLWQHSTGGPVFSSPALVTQLNGEYIVCGCHDGNLYCLDLRGELKWQRQLGNKPIFSSPFVGHTEQAAIIAACNTAGEIFVVSAAGELVTHVKCLGEVFSSPVLVESLLIVGSRDDSVYCFEFEE
jgi:acyl-CoA synthetase